MKLSSFILTASIVLSIISGAKAQQHPNHVIDYTGVNDTGYYMRNAKEFLAGAIAKRQNGNAAVNFSTPYSIRLFIRIVRETNGTLPGCTMATAIQNFNEMNVQYLPHNICFQLAGIDYVDDSYLNNFNIQANLSVVYPDYIRNNNLNAEGAMTIFIHYNFLDNIASSGNAYAIPNNFISVARWAVDASYVHSIFGHEIGHCLSLYHTFQRFGNVYESVTRDFMHPCFNCTTQGDLCEDTPADYDNSQSFTNSSTCIYNSTTVGSCDDLVYSPSTVNIMSYQPWQCISFSGTALTTDQETRMHATTNDLSGPVYNSVNEDNVVLNSFTGTSDRVRAYGAKNTVSTASGAVILQSASSKAYYNAGNNIIFSPGVTFSPGSGGLINAAIVTGCN